MSSSPSISFVVPTGGMRTSALRRLCDSLRDQFGDSAEIVLVGNVAGYSLFGDALVDMPAEADRGMICHMRNAGGRQAAGNLLVFLDDDISLSAHWGRQIRPFFGRVANGYPDVGTCRIVGPNGRRWYDWCWGSTKDRECPSMLLPYHRQHPSLYISGCCMIMRKTVFLDVLFDEELLNHQHDDVDFCHRALASGYSFGIECAAQLIHLLLPTGRNPEDTASGSDEFTQVIHLYRSGKLKDAQALLKRIEGAIPRTVFLYYCGLFALFMRQTKTAETSFGALLTEPGIEQQHGLLAQALYRLSLVKLMQQDKKGARRLLERVLERMPDHPFALARMARLDGKPMSFPI